MAFSELTLETKEKQKVLSKSETERLGEETEGRTKSKEQQVASVARAQKMGVQMRDKTTCSEAKLVK